MAEQTVAGNTIRVVEGDAVTGEGFATTRAFGA